MGNEQSDRKEIEHLRWLNRVIGAASSSLYLPIALRKASDEIQNLLPHHRASVALSSPGGEVATVYTTVGQTSSLRVGTTIPVSGSNVGSVIEGRVPILKADIEQEPEFFEKASLLAMGIQSSVNVPLWYGRVCKGSLNFGSYDAGAYGPVDAELANGISYEIGQSLVSAAHVQDLLNLRLTASLVDQTGSVSGPTLTRRESEVLRILALGAGNKEIADHLSLTVRTVRFHIENIYVKLGVQSRTQAVRVGREEGRAGQLDLQPTVRRDEKAGLDPGLFAWLKLAQVPCSSQQDLDTILT